jgi:esterase
MSEPVPDSRFLELRGLRIHYLDWGGDGPPLVTLHGTLAHAHTWDATAIGLRGSFHVYALDLRGHGDSGWATQYTLSELVEDLLAFVDQLGLDRITVMGQSFGGHVAYLFASRHPERVERLLVLEIAPVISPWIIEVALQTFATPVTFDSEDEAVAAARAIWPQASDESLRTRQIHNLKKLPDGRYTYKWDKAFAGAVHEAVHSTDELWAAWGAVTVPTLWVLAADSVVPREVIEPMLAANTNAELAIVPESGHAITQMQPEGLLKVIVPWLQRTAAS